MHPIFLKIGPLTIRYYGLMAAIGFLVGAWLLDYNKKFAKLTSEQSASLIFTVLVSGILGARIYYVIQFWDQFRNNYWQIIRIDQGGLVFFGGFILAVISIFIFCRRHKLDMVRIYDVLVPSVAFGHAAGRVGCFLNGCCYGKVTDTVFGVKYPLYSAPYLRYGDAFLHPVQLYEAGFNLILASAAVYVLHHSKKGVTTAFYLIGYGIMRFGDEFFRGDHPANYWLSPAQIIGLLILIFGIGFMIYSLKHEKEDCNA